MNNIASRIWKPLTGGAIVSAIATAVLAQEKPYTQPGPAQPPPPPPGKEAPAAAPAGSTPAPASEPNPVETLFNVKIPDAIAQGKFNLNARLRYEFVEQDGVAAITDDSHALTLRTRFGFTTAPLY